MEELDKNAPLGVPQNTEYRRKAIEKEKQEFEEGTLDENENNDEGAEVDTEIFEFSLDEEEINELIEKLNQLKYNKVDVDFDIDDENSLLIHYEESEEGEE